MIKILLLITILGFEIVPCVPQQAHTSPETAKATFRWLGALPPDEFYSARLLHFGETKGLLVTRDVVLESRDGGLKWNNVAYVRGIEALNGIIAAWLSSSDRLYLISDSRSLGTNGIDFPVTIIPANLGSRFNVAIDGDTETGIIIVVGGENVPVTKERFADVPRYAQGSNVNSPYMRVAPIISVSKDKARTWHYSKFKNDMGLLDGIKISGDNAVAWGPYEILVSSDRGLSWHKVTTDIPNEEEDAYPVSASIVGNNVYVSTKSGRLLKGSVVSGPLRTVSHIPSPLMDLMYINELIGFGLSSPDQPTGKREQDLLMKTKDGGITWNPILKTRRIVALSTNRESLCGASYDRLFCTDLPQ